MRSCWIRTLPKIFNYLSGINGELMLSSYWSSLFQKRIHIFGEVSLRTKTEKLKTKQKQKNPLCIPESATGVRPALLEFGKIRGRAEGPIKGLKGLGFLLM